ncbi:MAG: DUF2244 domain-containing protein [Thiobacillus sp.]
MNSEIRQWDAGAGTDNPAGTFVFHSRPRCSLTRTQERWFFRSLVVLCFGPAIGFAALGYWLVLPFAGLEIGLLAWALETMRKREGNYETLTIDGDAVVLEWREGARSGCREMNRRWARVQCDCISPGRNCRISMRSHGLETELGQYLSDEARLQLATTLRNRLQVG